MMKHLVRAYSLFLFMFAFCRETIQVRPILTPEGEFIIDEGDPLKIACTGSEKLYFVYPQNKNTSTSTLETQEYDNNGTQVYIFHRPKTMYGDTGWYGCADHPILDVSIASYEDPTINWVYVYVQSNTSAFVETHTYNVRRNVSGGTIIIPCRPTSPNYNVTLTTNDDNSELFEKVTFDPRIGYKLSNLTVHDSGHLICSINHHDTVQEIHYEIIVDRKQDLPNPKIINDTISYVVRGQMLRVNCTVDIDADTVFSLTWSTPQQGEKERIRTQDHRVNIGRNMLKATVELIIQNVTDQDAGKYECVIISHHDSKKAVQYISIHDPAKQFINLTAQGGKTYYDIHYGYHVQWVVYIHAYPEPDLKWLDPHGKEITGSWLERETAKHAVLISPYKTYLRINDLRIDDMGIYTLQATNRGKIEVLNFTLDVLAAPIMRLMNVTSSYKPNQVTEIKCEVAAYPAPNITLTYLKCPDYPSRVNATLVELTNVTISMGKTLFFSKANMTVDYSGLLNCTACNEVGCNSNTDNIFVSDGNGFFGIIRPTEPVTEGDDLKLVCAASVYNYTDSIEWQLEDGTPLPKIDRLQVVRNKTRFTYRSILRITNVSMKDARSYVCTVKNVDGAPEHELFYLRINSQKKPVILNTNMNQTDTIIDLTVGDHPLSRSLTFWCTVGGMPKPTVTWYKDDKVLESNERLKTFNNGQELQLMYLLGRDSGKYSCRVENRVGMVEAYQQVTVKENELPKGSIISIVILIITVVVLIIYFMRKVRRERIMRMELAAAGLMHFEEGALECLNPDLTVDDQAELLPYDKKWEFPRERLKLGKQLGSGAFGVVMKAEARGICEEEMVTTVAVKMVRGTTDPMYVRALVSELKIMIHLGKHLNVVNLLGACTKNLCKRELLVIVEYCRFGNLHNYLQRHRADFVNQIDPTTGKFDPSIGIDLLTRTTSIGSNNSLSMNSGTESVHYCQGSSVGSQGVTMSPEGCVTCNNSSQPGWRSNYRGDYKDYNVKPICTQDLLSWAFQVARGMEYLSQRRVLHGDLAARNILLAEDNIVKICDFGLAKTMYKDNNYKKKGDGPLPIKWMAIESIRDRIFSTQSDIWSFGIVLWEFFTLAETPYPGMEAEKQYQKLIEGYRMEQPEYATPEVHKIMLQCWKAKPTLRPSFTELVKSIGDLLEESVKAHYISLNDPYIDMNTMTLENGKNDYLTMMTPPDHAALSSPTHEYINSPTTENPLDSSYLCMSPVSRKTESGIFSPRPHQEKTHFEFPSPTSDSEDAVELSPMLKKEEDDPYLKPVNVQERRAEFARQRQALKEQIADPPSGPDSGYCNAPQNIHLIDLSEKNENNTEVEKKNDDKHDSKPKKEEFSPSIIKTQDNYVNIPKQKSDLRKDMRDGFSNPSYAIMGSHELNKTKV